MQFLQRLRSQILHLTESPLPVSHPIIEFSRFICHGSQKMNMIRHQDEKPNPPMSGFESPQLGDCITMLRSGQPRLSVMCADGHIDDCRLARYDMHTPGRLFSSLAKISIVPLRHQVNPLAPAREDARPPALFNAPYTHPAYSLPRTRRILSWGRRSPSAVHLALAKCTVNTRRWPSVRFGPERCNSRE